MGLSLTYLSEEEFAKLERVIVYDPLCSTLFLLEGTLLPFPRKPMILSLDLLLLNQVEMDLNFSSAILQCVHLAGYSTFLTPKLLAPVNGQHIESN